MEALPLLDTILRWWVLLALAVVGGGFAYTPLVARSSVLGDYRQLTVTRRQRLLYGALLFAGAATLLDVVYGLLSMGAFALRWPVSGILAGRLVLLALLGGMLWRRRDESGWVLVPVVSLLLTQSLLSHSAALSQPVAPVLADWVHLVFSSLWLGGVAMFALVSAPLAEPKDLGLLIARFSPLAMFCVLTITLTGIVQSASFLGSVEALLNTSYGRVILLKVMLLLVLIGLGAFHQQVISPRLQAWRLRDVQGAQQAVRRFRIGILLELVVSALILLAAGALTALSPASAIGASFMLMHA
jgi:putative copper export protein